jgi:hypothetical protein
MIFFVDHHAELLGQVDHHGTSTFGVSQLAADHLPLDKKLAIKFIQRRDIHVTCLLKCLKPIELVAHRPFNGDSIIERTASDEWELGEVPSQADPAADHDIGFRAGSAEPFAAAFGHIVEICAVMHERR